MYINNIHYVVCTIMSSELNMKRDLHSALKEIGLKDNEINLYTAALSLGPTSIARLAETLAIPRPNVYKLIFGLEKHGLANFSHRKKHSRKFFVESPTTILLNLQKRKENISKVTENITSVMPDLYSLYHQGAGATRVKILKTEKDYITAVTEMINEVKSEICFFGSFDNFINTITQDTFIRFTDLRISKNVLSRTLILPSKYYSELKSKCKEDLRDIKTLNLSNDFITSFQLSSHSVIIWQPEGSLAIWIQDECVVAMMKTIFECLWQQSK